MQRGSFQFDAQPDGALINSQQNVDALRRLWLDRTMINDEDLGPGNPGDFDHGAWHVACHLVGAGGARKAADGRVLWLEVSHDAATDRYYATVTTEEAGAVQTFALESPKGKQLLAGSTLLGFVEGNSTGRTSAGQVNDPPNRFNGWLRQDFDQPASGTEDGGKVWEHWCTVRDIRPPHELANSVLAAYVALCSALGDKFAPAVARGRRSYGHPTQLCALVKAGFTTKDSALWDIKPLQLDTAAAKEFNQAKPQNSYSAAEQLAWANPPCYYMFKRRITSWSKTAEVRQDLQNFG